jgi:glycosyltransferase involved in cell wall biosynthesis
MLVFWRHLDQMDAQQPVVLIANSRNIQKKIQTFYKRDSLVVYPPVSIPYRPIKRQASYYMCVSHLLKQKHIELAIGACNMLRVPLKIVGDGPQRDALRRLAGPTIEFLGSVSDSQVSRLYEKAKGLVYTSVDEDFGIVPVEAMAHGVPVVAYCSGAIPETVLDKKTGWLFDDLTVEGVANAIQDFEKHVFDTQVLRKKAKEFSPSIFYASFKKIVRDVTGDRTHNK